MAVFEASSSDTEAVDRTTEVASPNPGVRVGWMLA
jgi:hypothetical protein